MRAGREDGFGYIYDKDCELLLYQDEYVVSQEKGFVTSDSPLAPFPVTEGELMLTNWRLVCLGPSRQEVHVDTVQTLSHRGMRVRPELSHPICDYLEIYLDEIRDFKKTLLGEVKLSVLRGAVEVSGVSKEFRSELLKALDWYSRSKR